jgi:hypothetical protein
MRPGLPALSQLLGEFPLPNSVEQLSAPQGDTDLILQSRLKIISRLGAEESIGNQGKNQSMNHYLLWRMEEAKHYME